jgi:hypothetical protein
MSRSREVMALTVRLWLVRWQARRIVGRVIESDPCALPPGTEGARAVMRDAVAHGVTDAAEAIAWADRSGFPLVYWLGYLQGIAASMGQEIGRAHTRRMLSLTAEKMPEVSEAPERSHLEA